MKKTTRRGCRRFSNDWRGSAAKGWRPADRQAPLGGYRPAIEALECRAMLSVTPGGDEIVVANTAAQTILDDMYTRVAVDADGDFVVVWQDDTIDGDGQGIAARRFDAGGNPLGSQFAVNTFTAGDQTSPELAMNDAGQFVVTWQSADQDGSGWGIFAQIFDAAGNAVGGEIAVNTTVVGNQSSPAVAIDPSGNVAIVWAGNHLRRFDATGAPLTGEIDAGVLGGTGAPAVEFDGAGNFLVADHDGSTIIARRFLADGTPVDFNPTQFTFDGFQESLFTRMRIAMNARGEYVLALSGESIVAQRFGADGQINAERIEYDPGTGRIEVLAGLSNFGLTLDDAGSVSIARLFIGLSTTEIAVLNYDPDGTQQETVSVALDELTQLQGPDLVLNQNGQGVIVWSRIAHDGMPDELLTRRLTTGGLRPVGLATSLGEMISSEGVVPYEETTFVVHLSQAASEAGGSSGVHSVTNAANWRLMRGTQDVSYQILGVTYDRSLVTIELVSPLLKGNYSLVMRDKIHDLHGNAVDGDDDHVPGGDGAVRFTIGPLVPVGPRDELRRGTDEVALATNSLGDSVAVYSRGTKLYAQRYSANGVAEGAEITVATGSLNPVSPAPHVEIDDAGNFTILWGAALYRYDAAGNTIGQPILFAGTPPKDLAVDLATGRFAVIQSGVLHLYENTINPSGLTISTGMPGTQEVEQVTFLSDGSLVVATTATSQIFVRHFSASGSALSPATSVGFVYTWPWLGAVPVSLAANPLGGFAVAWQMSGNVSSSNETDRFVMARLYDETMTPLGDAFRVNFQQPWASATENPLAAPAIAYDLQGRLVVAWANLEADYDRLGVYVRGYTAEGVALGDPFRVSTPELGNQVGPAVSAGGLITIGWTTGDDGVRLQRFVAYDQYHLDLNGSAPGVDYTVDVPENGPPMSIVDASGLTIEDAGTGTLVGARVQIVTDPYGATLAVDTSGTNISAVYDDGVLTLSGEDTLANYQQVLRSTTYQTTVRYMPEVDVRFEVDYGPFKSASSYSRPYLYFPGATMTGRSLFYNQSKFDGNNEFIDNGDALAVAPDKTAYLPGTGMATQANVSSYFRGINGLMFVIDGSFVPITLKDLTFRMGTSNDPNTWQEAPSPTLSSKTIGFESDKRLYTLVWPSGAIQNTWLEVTVAANRRSQLVVPDVFYFGNRVGDTGVGNSPAVAVTNVMDQISVRNQIAPGQDITSPRDFNRDGLTNVVDEVIARQNVGVLPMLDLPGSGTPLAAPQSAVVVAPTSGATADVAATVAAGTLQAVASALATVADTASPSLVLRQEMAPAVVETIGSTRVSVSRPALDTQAVAALLEGAPSIADGLEALLDALDSAGGDED